MPIPTATPSRMELSHCTAMLRTWDSLSALPHPGGRAGCRPAGGPARPGSKAMYRMARTPEPAKWRSRPWLRNSSAFLATKWSRFAGCARPWTAVDQEHRRQVLRWNAYRGCQVGRVGVVAAADIERFAVCRGADSAALVMWSPATRSLPRLVGGLPHQQVEPAVERGGRCLAHLHPRPLGGCRLTHGH